jgi:hypothetical protein
MKKIFKFLFRSKEELSADKARRKKHFASLPKWRRVGYRAAICAAILMLFTGYITKTIHSTSALALIWLTISTSMFLSTGSYVRRAAVSVVLNPGTIMLAALVIGGQTLDFQYGAAMNEQSMLERSATEVANDAVRFKDNYDAGKVEKQNVHRLDDSILGYGANDRLAYDAGIWAAKAMHFKAPEALDTAALMPFPVVYYADRTFMLLDREMMKERGENFADNDTEAQPKSRNLGDDEGGNLEYKGIYILICSVKDDGEVLLATGLPSGLYSDLRNIPEGAPFVEACAQEALAR